MTFRSRDLDLDLDLWGFDPVIVQVAGTWCYAGPTLLSTPEDTAVRPSAMAHVPWGLVILTFALLISKGITLAISNSTKFELSKSFRFISSYGSGRPTRADWGRHYWPFEGLLAFCFGILIIVLDRRHIWCFYQVRTSFLGCYDAFRDWPSCGLLTLIFVLWPFDVLRTRFSKVWNRPSRNDRQGHSRKLFVMTLLDRSRVYHFVLIFHCDYSV